MTEQIAFPPLHDPGANELKRRRQHLLSETARTPDETRASLPLSVFRRPRWTLSARIVLVAVVAAFAAFALVPIGGASLGARAADRISSLWDTPPNQPALDRADTDAHSIAGGAYYTTGLVDSANNVVHLYLADAPQSVIDELNARHPGIYDIHNDAAHPLSALIQLQHEIPFGPDDPLQTADGPVHILMSEPTSDGYLKVGIEGHADVDAAQSALDSMYGTGIIKVFGGAQIQDGLVWHG